MKCTSNDFTEGGSRYQFVFSFLSLKFVLAIVALCLRIPPNVIEGEEPAMSPARRGSQMVLGRDSLGNVVLDAAPERLADVGEVLHWLQSDCPHLILS